jgi:hypothetical protein
MKVNAELKVNICERESRVPISPQSARQWQSYLIPQTQNMHVIKEQENTISRDKNNLSLVGTVRYHPRIRFILLFLRPLGHSDEPILILLN